MALDLIILLDPEDSYFGPEGQFIGISIKDSASILEAMKACFFLSIKDPVSGFAGNSKSRHKAGILSPFEKSGYKSKSFVSSRPLYRHNGLP